MSSGFSYPQPRFQSSIYNPAFYLSLDSSGYLTYDYAQTLYLSKGDYRMTYLSGVVPGTASIRCALVLGASGSISGVSSLSATNLTGTLQTESQPNITSLGSLSGLSISGNLSFSGSSRSISKTGASSYIDAREYRQIGTIFLTSIPTSLSLNNLSTSGDISCSGVINGILAYGNQSAITTVGSLTEVGINSTSTNEYFSITGSGWDFLIGSYTRMMTLTGSNTTPVQFQIQVHNGNRATTANASWIGNITNNDLRFGVNNSTSIPT
ncbi:unnamed protein product [Phytophthora lilii]|uniref:Unnamed protein product n=1 Tax=Phytophthora lilii TaxID=2077276 RepID=A0A9W6TGY3_9STRA|nr:unnamed protein product [Phytophthora lilii]